MPQLTTHSGCLPPWARPRQEATQPRKVAREDGRSQSHCLLLGRALLTAGVHLPTWEARCPTYKLIKSAQVDP